MAVVFSAGGGQEGTLFPDRLVLPLCSPLSWMAACGDSLFCDRWGGGGGSAESQAQSPGSSVPAVQCCARSPVVSKPRCTSETPRSLTRVSCDPRRSALGGAGVRCEPGGWWSRAVKLVSQWPGPIVLVPWRWGTSRGSPDACAGRGAALGGGPRSVSSSLVISGVRFRFLLSAKVNGTFGIKSLGEMKFLCFF